MHARLRPARQADNRPAAPRSVGVRGKASGYMTARTTPDRSAMRQAVVDQLAFLDTATHRHHCRGTKIIPFSMHNVDEMLDDLDLNIDKRVRAAHWLNPIAPAAYRDVTPALLRRIAAGQRTAAPLPADRPADSDHERHGSTAVSSLPADPRSG